MDRAKLALDNINKLTKLQNESLDGDIPAGDSGTTEPEETGAGEPKETSDNSATVEAKLSEVLADLGLNTINVTEGETGDVYADLGFEDGTNLSLEFYVAEGAAKVAVLNSDNMENPPEISLPDGFVDEDGNLNLSDLTDLPVDEIKSAISQFVTVTNKTEVYRRSRGTNENFVETAKKRRLSEKVIAKLKKKTKK